MRIIKQEKDKYPKSYGYGSVEQLEADKTRFGDDQEKPLTNWVSFRDGDGDLRFVPCTKEYFYTHRNENRNEERRNHSYSKHFPLSMDSLLDNYNFEFADTTYQDNLEKQKVKDTVDIIWSCIEEFSDIDQRILKLHSEGYTDAFIAETINKARSTVQDRRMKCIKLLKEKLQILK